MNIPLSSGFIKKTFNLKKWDVFHSTRLRCNKCSYQFVFAEKRGIKLKVRCYFCCQCRTCLCKGMLSFRKYVDILYGFTCRNEDLLFKMKLKILRHSHVCWMFVFKGALSVKTKQVSLIVTLWMFLVEISA